VSHFKGRVALPPRSAFDQFARESIGRLQAAALNATARAALTAKRKLRADMQGAGLGRLGNAVDHGSDAQKNGRVRTMGQGWSASGWLAIRSRSERTIGAIESYTAGAVITPKKGRWLWIATDDIPIRAGRQRMTPALYNKMGFASKIGPLVPVKASNGTPLLVVRNVGVSASGKSRSARSLTKRGLPRKGQTQADFIVAFYGIPNTSRQARVDVDQIIAEARASLPDLIAQELGRR